MKKEPHIIEGIHYKSGKGIRLRIKEGMISSIEEIKRASARYTREVNELPVIAPGMTDLQINGFRGVDFNDPGLTPEQVEVASQELLHTGITTYFPTLITGPPEKTSGLLKTFARAVGGNGMASGMIGGIHLEGPFISREEGPRGAHSREHCLLPDIERLKRWQADAQGMIRLVTMAPELPGTLPFIETCVAMDIVVGIGHTAANTNQINRAVEAGATLSTHLGNGCHATLPRHPNYLWDQLAHDGLFATMIADGFHLPDSVLKVFLKTKGDKALLISDGMTYTGLPPGTYESPATGRVRLTPEGKLHLEENPGTLAGSASTLLDGVKKISSFTGFSQAWEMASTGPARLMHLDASKGLNEGAPANLVLLQPDLSRPLIRKVILHQRK